MGSHTSRPARTLSLSWCNKPPVFDKEPYTAYVLENESQGYQVLTVTGSNLDRNTNLKYDIIEPIIARDKSGNELENVAE